MAAKSKRLPPKGRAKRIHRASTLEPGHGGKILDQLLLLEQGIPHRSRRSVARQRPGLSPLRRPLFRICRPPAGPDTPGAFYRGGTAACTWSR